MATVASTHDETFSHQSELITTTVSTRLPAAMTALLLIACGACDSATAPPLPSPAASAQFFDSIYAARVAKGTPDDSAYALFIALEFELPPAYGAREAALTVTTASGRQLWRGFAYTTTDNGQDTTYMIAAFSDPALTNMVVGSMARDGGGAALITTNPLTNHRDSTIAGSWGATTTLGATCSLQPNLQAAQWLADTGTFSCQNATLTLSMNATFLPVAGVGPLQVWSIENVTFDGPYIAYTTPSPLRKTPTLRRQSQD